MSTPLAVSEVIRVQYATYNTTHTQLGINRLQYKVITTGGESYESLPAILHTKIFPAFKAWLSTGCKFVGVSVQRIFNAAGVSAPLGPFYYYSTVVGSNGANTLPLQVSGLLRWTAGTLALGGDPPVTLPPTKGRTYVPFVAVNCVDMATQQLNAAGGSRLLSIASKMGPSVILPSTCNLELQVARAAAGGKGSVVTGLTIMKALATQRRRGDFGKINAAFGGVI